jgi:hypothetical protein
MTGGLAYEGMTFFGLNLQGSWTVMIPTPSLSILGEESLFHPDGF